MSLAIRRTLQLCLLTLVWLPLSGLAQNALSSYTQQQTQFLPVDEAYQLTLVADGDQRLMLQWMIAPEYYLYRHAFKTEASDAEGRISTSLAIPDGLAKTDEFFGDVEVYYDALDATVALERTTELAQIKVTYQGCADAGLCYPPETKSFLWHMASGEIQAGSLATKPRQRQWVQTQVEPIWVFWPPLRLPFLAASSSTSCPAYSRFYR